MGDEPEPSRGRESATGEPGDGESRDSDETEGLAPSRRAILGALAAGCGLAGVPGAEAHPDPYPGTTDQPGTDATPEELAAAMTLAEKIDRVHNHVGPLPDFATGYIPPTDRLDVPDAELCDGPVGIRHPLFGDEPDVRHPDRIGVADVASGGPSTAFPASISLAASFDPSLWRAFGHALGREAKAKGQLGVFAPAFNIARVPTCGRNFEYFGEDPHLVSRAAVGVIEGVQSAGTMATAKHFAANNQETNRRTISSEVGERALRELYFPAFRAAVEEAGVDSVMAAYNRLNGTYCTENEWLLTDVLKEEWGFDGFVISDYGAVHSTVPAANAGLDFEAPARETQYFGAPLRAAVERGDVPESRVEDMVERVLGRLDTVGRLDGDRGGPPGAVNTAEHQELARRIATDGAVLFENDGLLPLDAPDSIAVIGYEATRAKVGGGGSSNVTPPYEVSPLAGIRARAADETTVLHATGDAVADAEAVAAAADVAVVVADGSSLEGRDRDDITLDDDQNGLIRAVGEANPRTAVVLRVGGPVRMPWREDVAATFTTWYPGMEDGNATAELLFGDCEPRGRLPLTFGRELADYPANTPEQYPGVDGEVSYTEGVFVGYRHFDRTGTEPLFPFGHGCGYTTFAYDSLTVDRSAAPTRDPSFEATVRVRNVGPRPGTEVVQCYVAPNEPRVPRPPKELGAFETVRLDPDETRTVRLELDADAFALFDGAWVVDPGAYDLLVGRSAGDIRHRASIRLGGSRRAIDGR